MRSKTVGIAVLALTLLATAQSRVKPVSGDDVLQQLDTAILLDSLKKRTPEETLQLVRAIVTLNQMQISHASLSHNPQPEGAKALTENSTQAFYDLRRLVCEKGPSKVVDLDGELHNCN